MLKTILTYGVIAGVVAGGALSAVALGSSEHGALGMAIGYAIMLVALTAVFAGVKRHRDEALGGVIRFWPAFGLGLAISLVAGVVYAFCWEGALAMMGGSDVFIDGMMTSERAKAAADPAAAEQLRQMEAMRVAYRNPLFRLPMTFVEIAPVGVLVSLVSAALLRNSRFLPARARAAS